MSEVVLDSSASHSSMTNGLIYPICNQRCPGHAIENHANHCAESTFFELDDMNDEGTDNDVPEIIFPKTKSIYTKESLAANIKNLVSSSWHTAEGAFKFWRNHVFKRFCEKMESPRYQRQFWQNIYIKFYSEVAVDQGGPKQEFFTGKYIIAEYFLQVRAFIGISVLTHLCPMFPYHTPWKHQKVLGFLVFLGGIKWKHWPKMGETSFLTPIKEVQDLNSLFKSKFPKYFHVSNLF